MRRSVLFIACMQAQNKCNISVERLLVASKAHGPCCMARLQCVWADNMLCIACACPGLQHI